MTTALGIAAVTHVLKNRLEMGLNEHDVTGKMGRPVHVTNLPPDRIDVTSTNEATSINLFMYQARPNASWSNEGYPTFDGNGRRVGRTPLALDLYYVLSAYGQAELHTDVLLGYGMQLFHEMPILSSTFVQQALTGGNLPTNLPALGESGLASQVERIKISPEVLNTEEMSRLWTAFQAKYRPTAVYRVTAVLIESGQAVGVALPVRDRTVHATPSVVPAHIQPGLPMITAQAYTNATGSGSDPRSGTLTLTLATPVKATQRIGVLLNSINDPNIVGPKYSFAPTPMGPAVPSTTSLTVPVQRVLPGTYLLRVRIDGVESTLTTVTGPDDVIQYNGPAILIE